MPVAIFSIALMEVAAMDKITTQEAIEALSQLKNELEMSRDGWPFVTNTDVHIRKIEMYLNQQMWEK